MASIRRAQSPSFRSRASSSSFTTSLRRLLFSRPSSRKPSNAPWKRSLLRFSLCFLLGFLLGLFPFAHQDLSLDPSPRNFAFEIGSADTEQQRGVILVKQGSRVIETLGIGSMREVNLESRKQEVVEGPARKLLIVVTPTYNRVTQAYYLGRMGQTLRLVPPSLLWIVVEMGAATTETADLLRRTGVMYRHLVCQKNSTDVKDRGVHQRNVALEHIERHKMDGIIYFADDDNVYSLELFERIREIRRFGTWPVAMLAKSKSKTILEGPVCNGSQIVGWHTNEKSKRLRRFHVDMSGFAFSSTILWDPRRWLRPTSTVIRQLDTVKEGFQETTFIEQVVKDESQMEAVPSDCSKIMTWHLHLDVGRLHYPKGWKLSRNLEFVVPLK